MSLKLIAPLAGIIGTIASVVGVSTSNSRPEKAANPIPSHLWKVEKVETITLETKCRVEGGGGTRDDYSLKLTLGLERNKSKELLKSQNVSVGAEFEFKALWGWGEIREIPGGGWLGVRMEIQLKKKQE